MILLDTNICIAALKNEHRVLSHLIRHTGQIYLPFMVSAELWFGLEKNALLGREVEADRSRVEEFHDRVDGILYVTDEVIQEYARLRAWLEVKGTPISPNDTWIAAQALTEDARLVSANTREFKRVPNLRLENWLK
ncbi:MAG: type II toxin-antitoxin system VapC family toxin [Pseudomonadota bacterium]|nr:type II toxin-antitoxin system VapC family toxin [Pseudomonadota bacterium]